MSTKTQTLIATISIFCLIVVLGCASFQDVLTPCRVSQAAARYADVNETSILPWTTLFDSKRINMKLDYVHTKTQLVDALEYEYHKGITRFHEAAGEELKATLFEPTGPIGLLVTSALGGTAGGLLFSKPTDKKKIKELEIKNNSKNT